MARSPTLATPPAVTSNIMKKNYKIKELLIYGDNPEEQSRVRDIFYDIERKAINNEFLTEHEKDFFSRIIKLYENKNYDLNDFNCCSNYIFKSIYRNYWFDLTGASSYTKILNQKLENIPKEEVKLDLNYLINEAENWKNVLVTKNNSEELIKQVIKETNERIEELNNSENFINDIVLQGSFYYRYKLWSVLLLSKYLYLTSLSIIEKIKEETGSFPYLIELKQNEIEFNEYSLVHIMFRHFAEKAKNFKTNKSHHSEDFDPWYLAYDLSNIFHRLEYQISNIENSITFEYKGQVYDTWFKKKTKSIKGGQKVKYKTLSTFYPVKDLKRLEVIDAKYKRIPIDDELILYN